MKLVTWRGNYPKKCYRCPHMIQKGEQAWRVGGGRQRKPNHIKYYCLECGDEIQH